MTKDQQIVMLRAACKAALAWIENMRPTKQRLALAQILQNALTCSEPDPPAPPTA